VNIRTLLCYGYGQWYIYIFIVAGTGRSGKNGCLETSPDSARQYGELVTGLSLILPGTHGCIAVVNKRTRMYFGNVWMGMGIGIRI